ncbi:MAG TPA: aminoglycoside phosphotransferase family protein [Gaiellaceae bacterium]
MRELDERVERATGSAPVRYEPRPGGYSTADRFAVTLADGRRVFVKSSPLENLAEWIRREHEVYAHLGGSFMPQLVGFDDDGERPVLAIEDLSDAEWSVRWDEGRVRAVLAAVEELAASDPPPGTSTARAAHPELWSRWDVVRETPEPFLGLGLRDAAWLDRALPVLLDAAASVGDGADLCHFDIRSDNMCFRGGRALLVDWNWCCIGDSRLDVAAWLPSLAREGGPRPWEVLGDGGPYAAMIAGVWAAVAGLPPPETAPTVREVQRRQLAVALEWIDRDLL